MGVSSSPDPLALPMESSPIRGSQKRSSNGPLSSRSVNITSPSKSVYLESRDGEKGSPWRIKVTVQAEPASPPINRSILPSRTHVKDTQSSSPVKRLTRRSRKTASSPIKDSPMKTVPVRRRNNSNQPHDLIEIPDNETNDYSLSEIDPPTMHTHNIDSQDHAYTSGSASNELPLHHAASRSAGGALSSQHKAPSPRHPSPEHATGATAALPPSRTNTSPGFPTEQHWTDDEADATLGAQAPGEATVLESEEFSMISVDSLCSVPHLGERHTPRMLSEPSRKPKANETADVSYMPSSPPTYLPAYRLTPLPSDSPPKDPAAPAQSSFHHSTVGTPLQESARKSGRALQDVLTGPSREPLAHTPALPRGAIFNGFSTGTRRQLRESLHTGQQLATPQLDSQSNFGFGILGGPHFAPPAPIADFASPFQSPVRLNSNVASHRLPTPEENDASDEAGVAVGSHVQVQYPNLVSTLEGRPQADKSLASPYVGYDAMSWVATKQGNTTGGFLSRSVKEASAATDQVVSPSNSSRHTTPRTEVESGSNASIRTPAASQGDELPVQSQQDGESEASKDIWQEEADLWQEEASRSVHDGTPPMMRDDLVVRPRRAKLPGTWRRRSEAPFSYSDSPEPENVAMRKISAATSVSGIMTPPATEDEGMHAAISIERQETKAGQEIQAADVQAAGEAHSPTERGQSCDSSDGEDTGAFWQKNLPSVFNRRTRTSRSRARPELSSPRGTTVDAAGAEERTFAESSPLRNTMFDISPVGTGRSPLKMQRVNGGIKRNPQSDSALMPSPLRNSMLKSSKIGGASGVRLRDRSRSDNNNRKDSTVQEMSDESNVRDTSSSMASDVRQLQNEMSRYLAAENDTMGPMPELPIEHTEVSCGNETPQSYVEELHRESPVRIRVNFNDSSATSPVQDSHMTVHDNDGRSVMLSPKKQYPHLFDNAPSLKSSSGSRVRKNGFVSRLTDSFWEAVTAPAPYVPAEPKAATTISESPDFALASTVKASQSVPPAAVFKSQKTKSTSISTTSSVPDHVLRLRRKYGLLPDTHPFTYAHIRTLHRMLNSIRADQPSLIPCSGPLPPASVSLLNKTATNDLDQHFIWTEKYVHMVEAYLSLLLPASQRKRLVEHTGEEWGDEEAKRHRGFDSKGRHGTQKVFKLEEKGKITREWVIGIVEGILFKEEMNDRKKKVQQLLAMESSAVSAA